MIDNVITIEIIKQHYLPALNNYREWSVTERNGQPVVLNVYSYDEFTPHFAPLNCNSKLLQDFQRRQQYTLPNTPKVIIVSNKNYKNGQLLLLTQRGQYDFQNLLEYYNEQKSMLELAFIIVKTAQMLSKKYRTFKLTENMIRGSKGPTLILWINENQAINKPQHLIQNQKVGDSQAAEEHLMIKQMLSLLSHKMSLALIKQILKDKQILTFQIVKKRISDAIKEKKTSPVISYIKSSEKLPQWVTEQRRSNIPSFLANRSFKNKSPQNISQFQQNSVSSITIKSKDGQFFRNTLNSPNEKNRIIYSEHRSGTPHKNSLHFKSKKKEQKQEFSLHNPSEKNMYWNKWIENSPSIAQLKNTQVNLSQKFTERVEKNKVRDSGNTISTTAQPFSINSSGKQVTNIQEYIEGNLQPKNKLTLVSTFGRSKKRTPQRQRNIFEIKISKIIEEKFEEANLKNSSQRSPSPNSPKVQQSPNKSRNSESPGSQFERDVSLLFRSGRVDKRPSSESITKIQGEINLLLCD